MSPATSLPPIKFRPVPRLLDHIGLAMYSNLNKAIAELVVNGYDADATQVDVEISAKTIVIKDNGSGMDEGDIRNSYMMLGADQKRKVKRTSRFSRLPIGNKGIGKLAGLGIARRISIETIKDGHCFTYEIDRDELEKSKTLEEAHHDLKVEEADGKKQGTTIVLSKIMPHVRIDTIQLLLWEVLTGLTRCCEGAVFRKPICQLQEEMRKHCFIWVALITTKKGF